MAALRLAPDGPAPHRGHTATPAVEVWPAPTAPLEVAHALGAERIVDGTPTLVRWRKGWWEYKGAHWAESEDEAVRGWIYNRLRDGTYQTTDKGAPVDMMWNPDRTKVTNILDAYSSSVAHLAEVTEPGTWLPTGQTLRGVVAMPSGLFNVATRQTTPNTPRMFTTWSLPFDYEDQAPAPSAWLAFLASVWPDEEDTIEMLQEWMGYLVSGRTDLQKAMLLVGPKRSGKGTILRVCTQLAGMSNTAAPTLAAMTSEFGLQTVIGKMLIAVGDARLAGQTSTLVERLLSIVGEDSIQVNRKYRDPWMGRLHARVMIASNEVPDFRDASGAIGSRFLVTKMVRSHYGQEDVDLEGKLLAELPGILRWALDGLDRLNERGRFAESKSAVDARDEMEESESPVAQFVDAACVVGPHTVPRDVLYAAWNVWRERHGYAPSNDSTFGRQLRAAQPMVTDVRKASAGVRVRCYSGIGLSETFTGTDHFGNDGAMSSVPVDILRRAIDCRVVPPAAD